MRTIQYALVLLATALLTLAFTVNASAQVNASGMPNIAPIDNHETDSVDLLNNTVVLHAPIRSKAGTIPMFLSLSGSSFVANTNGIWVTGLDPGGLWEGISAEDQNFLRPGNFTFNVPISGVACPGGGTTTKYTNWGIIDASGTVHALATTLYTDKTAGGTSCLTGSGFASAVAIDGSGYSTGTIAANATLLSGAFSKNGATVSGGSVTDANGNIALFQAGIYNDPMGTVVVNTNGSNYGPFSWTDVNGGTPGVNITTSNLTLDSTFGCTGIGEINHMFTTAMPSTISFPDGTSIGLTYEGAVGKTGKYTGRINQITLRQGGTVTYTYGNGTHNSINCTYQTVPTLTRTQGNGEVTTYSLVYSQILNTSNYKAVNTVTDPGSNVTQYQFTGFTSSGASATNAQVLTQVTRNKGASTLLDTIVYCYNTAYASCNFTSAATATVTLPITKIVMMRKINGKTTYSGTEKDLDSYGNVTYTAQFDFGSTTASKATTINYGTWNGSMCVALGNTNVKNKVCEISSTQGSNTVADARYTRDTNGNLLSTSVWTGSSWIGQSTNNIINANGTPSIVFDLANNETELFYQTAGYFNCPMGGCLQYPFPTKITNVGTGLSTTFTYDARGGVPLTSVDPNLNQTNYCYNTGMGCSGGTADPYWRIMQTVDPYGTSVANAYPSGSGAAFSYSNLMTFNSGNSIEGQISEFDSYGRPSGDQVPQSPGGSNYDTISESYSYTGNYFTVKSSQPCSTTLGASCTTVHTNEFDPLGRLFTEFTTNNETVTHTYTQNDDLAVLTPAPSGETSTGKQVQNEYDGLGRLTSSCQISSLVSGNALCGQVTNTTWKGLVTTTTYTSAAGSTAVSSTLGSETRSQTFDALGRLTTITIPEGNPSGTTASYQYDSGGGCGSTHNGKLVAFGHPRDGQCLFYDTAGRLIEIAGSVSWPTFTACRWFYYDNSTGYTGTIPSGISVTNGLGRLVEAATDNCAGTHTTATLVTDEWFAYDKDGRTTDIWEKTPHSTQYYHSVATFFENGLVKTLQLASPNLYTVTYALDGEGRWKSLTDTTTAQNIVTGATYYPAANPAQVSLTSSDNDSYTVDSYTGRMDQFVFTVGPKSETGALTWSANGTLKQLAITDGFNASGTQTCHFNPTDAAGTGYDDVMRLVGVDCGSGQWGQTFTYDQYDNLSKAVISGGRIGSTYNPGYPTSAPFNNHCNICTYDSDGNVISDGSNTYGWDEFAKLKWTATSGTPTCGSTGECITYDAFGRMLEDSSGGAYNEMWITQLGTIVQMAGTTPNYGYFPAPENGTAIINGSSASYGYLHKDWLGSARIVSSITGHGVTVDQAFSPYGEIYDQVGSTNSPYDMFAEITQNFTPGVMWDTPNRELSVVGRWLSPDPANVGWNQYAYPTNPNSFNDPTGLFKCAVDPDTGGPLRGQPCSTVGDPYFGGGGDDGYGGGGGFSFGFNFGIPCSDFMPCGLPLPGLWESLWSDVLGLPTGLNCPQVGGISDYLCGGVSPAMDAGTPAACQNVTPSQFDYTSPQIYIGENGNLIFQSAQQHIQQGHIFPGEAGNTMYGVFPWPGTNAVFQQVQAYNAATFTFGQASQEGSNGNITFTLPFPVTINPFNKLPAVIGYTLYGGLGVTPLNTNKLVLAPNCKLVRTSYPI